MARSSSSQPPVEPTIAEITMRYHACAVELANALGVPYTEAFLIQHRESISCCFIESSKLGVRLPERVHLPPLKPAEHSGVPVAGVQKTTICTFMVKGEEENEGLHP